MKVFLLILSSVTLTHCDFAKVDDSVLKKIDFPCTKSRCNPVTSANNAGQLVRSDDAVWCVWPTGCQTDRGSAESYSTPTNTHTSKLCCCVWVNISSSSGCWIVDTDASWSQGLRVIQHVLDWSTVSNCVWVTNRYCNAVHSPFWLLYPQLTHFYQQTLVSDMLSCRLLIPSSLRALLIPSNCAGCLGNQFKSFLY